MSMGTLILIASASRPTRLESEIKETYHVPCVHWHGLPKALLPISGQPALSWWYKEAVTRFKDVYIVSNAYNYKHYERWATGNNFPKTSLLNCGFSAGPLSDIGFVQRVKALQGMVTIMTADYLYTANDPSISALAQDANVLYCHGQGDLVSLVLAPEVLQQLIRDTPHYPASKSWSVREQKEALCSAVAGFSAAVKRVTVTTPSAARFMHEDLPLTEYMSDWLAEPDLLQSLPDPIHVKAYARVGLMGNPSDGFYGKTMSLLIANFWAEVTLLPHRVPDINILSNPVADPRKFSTLESLAAICGEDGYDHGDRLLLACAKVFFSYCKDNGIQINTRRGFRAMFDTNVPRQVGLAGSSAIVTAFWKALLKFYGVVDTIPIEKQASLVLSVEQDELGIAAGLQDRVIQAYGGLVYMDFNREFVEKHTYGKYQSLDISLVPHLFLAYVAHPEDSGKVHSTVKQRFLNNDPDIIQAMRNFASFTDQARKALEEKDHHTFAQLMTANFEQRRKTYGDAVVGATNLRMVELARQHRCVAKFPGSGGAIVGMWDGDDETTRSEDLLKLRHALEKEGYVYVEIIPKEQQV